MVSYTFLPFEFQACCIWLSPYSLAVTLFRRIACHQILFFAFSKDYLEISKVDFDSHLHLHHLLQLIEMTYVSLQIFENQFSLTSSSFQFILYQPIFYSSILFFVFCLISNQYYNFDFPNFKMIYLITVVFLISLTITI